MVDTGDYKEVKGRKSAHKARRDQELYELQGLLKSYAARFFLWRLLSECGIYKALPISAEDMPSDAGRKDIGLWLLSELEMADSGAYSLMRDEAVSRDAEQKGKTNG